MMLSTAFGFLKDILDSTIRRVLGPIIGTNGLNQLDIEKGQARRLDTVTSTSVEDMTKATGAWNKAKVWEDLRQDQNLISGARQRFEANKLVWIQEQQQREERLELQKKMFEAERLAWKQEQELQRMELDKEKRLLIQEKETVHRLKKEAAEIINAKAKIEEIVKSMADRSNKTGAKLKQLKNQVDKLPPSQVVAITAPTTPPISPTLPLEQAIILPGKMRARASQTAMTY